MIRRLLAGLAIGGALIGAPSAFEAAAQSSPGPAPKMSSLGVDGTEIVVTLGDGRTLRSKDLIGAVLKVRFEGQPADVRIAVAEPDPEDKSKTVWLHTFEARQADGTWANLCGPGPDGRRQGFALKTSDGGLDLTCTSGAVGKCVRFGYRPWATGSDGKSLAPQHAACVRMVRGDYGGAGEAFTRDGMSIDLYDPQGLQAAEMAADQAFEAGWTPEGAVCVHHVRVKENTTLAALEAAYPRLEGRTGAVCTEDFARANGAILFNRSRD
ncbi:ADYC domain-containing protein [Reyranella sp.]|uniref:ADYC domain-containing protein n=1 Tax=Reyranella sp. TaxID=1929291 RepID=UPI003F719837